jgi:hypothetical protein
MLVNSVIPAGEIIQDLQISRYNLLSSPTVASFLLPLKAFAAAHIMICELCQEKYVMTPVRFCKITLA